MSLSKIFKIAGNEIFKNFAKLGTWFVVGIVVLNCLLFGIINLVGNYIERADTRSSIVTTISNLEDGTYAAQDENGNPIEESAALAKEQAAILRDLLNKKVVFTDWRYRALRAVSNLTDNIGSIGAGGISGSFQSVISSVMGGTVDENTIKYVQNNDWAGYMGYNIGLLKAGILSQNAISDPTAQTRIDLMQIQLNNQLKDPWADNLIEQIISSESQIDSLNAQINDTTLAQKEINAAKKEKGLVTQIAQMDRYALENSVPPAEGFSFLAFYNSSSTSISIVMILAILLAAGIMAAEFSSGTIKLLAITPYSRVKLLYGKYTAALGISAGYLVLQAVVMFIVGVVFIGGKGMFTPYLSVVGGKVAESSYLLHILGNYALGLVPIIMCVTLAYMVSTLLRSNVWAIVVSFAAYFLGSLLMTVFAVLRWDISRFWIFNNTNLAIYFDVNTRLSMLQITPTNYPSLLFSLAMICAYLIIFHAAIYFSFTKRDIA